MKTGLFDLSDLESGGMDDVMKLNLFGEGTDITGSAEAPSGKLYDAAGIPVPKATVISAETYNSALTALKKSFKEGYDILGMLENAEVVSSEVVTQESFTENAIYEAMVSSYYDGPVFEAVQNENKQEIKTVAKKVRKSLCKFTRSIKWYFKKINTGERLGLLDPFFLTTMSDGLKLRTWQMVCLMFPARGTAVGDSIKSLNDEFKEDLGDKYELKLVKVSIGWIKNDIEDLTDEDKANTRKLSKYYLCVVDEKGAKQPDEIEVKINKADLAKLLKAQEASGQDKK